MDNNRRYGIIELSEEELTALIQPIFSGQRVEAAELLSGGAINTNYKLNVSGSSKPYVMRVFARDTEAGEREAAISELIGDTVPVARTLYRSTQEWSAGNKTLDQRVGSYAIVEWRPGVVLQAVLDSGATGIEDAFVDAGRVLAEISKYKFAKSGFFGKELEVAQPFGDDPTAYMRECLNSSKVRGRLGDDLCERTTAFVETNRERLFQAGAASACLVHGDFNAGNLLVSRSNGVNAGKWCVSAVLDWEFAHAGSLLFDIGNMLRNEHKFARLEVSFIQGFTEAGGALPPDWRAMSRFVDLNNLLEFLTGADRSWLYEEVRAAIARIITRE